MLEITAMTNSSRRKQKAARLYIALRIDPHHLHNRRSAPPLPGPLPDLTHDLFLFVPLYNTPTQINHVIRSDEPERRFAAGVRESSRY